MIMKTKKCKIHGIHPDNMACPVCEYGKEKRFVLLNDVVIPAGTVLDRAPNERGGDARVEAVIGIGKDATAYFNMGVLAIEDAPDDLITEVK